MSDSSGSLLFGLDGVVVESVHVDIDRTRTIIVLTALEWVGVCPDCTSRSSRSKGWVSTRPRDIKIGPDIPGSSHLMGAGVVRHCVVSVIDLGPAPL